MAALSTFYDFVVDAKSNLIYAETTMKLNWLIL